MTERLEPSGPDLRPVANRRIYSVWKGMRERCNNPASDNYARYGAAGITVCAEWDDFSAFCAWALANGYGPKLTIDRRDNRLGYFPVNCRWATSYEQTANRRNVQKRADGKPWFEVAQENGIPLGTYQNRLGRGWDTERAATEPPSLALGRHLFDGAYRETNRTRIPVRRLRWMKQKLTVMLAEFEQHYPGAMAASGDRCDDMAETMRNIGSAFGLIDGWIEQRTQGDGQDPWPEAFTLSEDGKIHLREAAHV